MIGLQNGSRRNVTPECTLLGKEVLYMPEGHRLGGYLHPVRHRLPFLMREGVYCYSDLARSSLERNCQ